VRGDPMYPGMNSGGAIVRYHGPPTSPCPIDKAYAAILAFIASVSSDSPQWTSKPAVKTTEGRAYTHHWQRMLAGRDAIGVWLFC